MLWFAGKVVEILWKYGDIPASQLYKLLEEKVSWNKQKAMR